MVDERHGKIGIEPDRSVVVRDGAIDVALHLVGLAAIVEGLDEVEVEPDRIAVIRDRGVDVALGLFGVAAVVVGRRVGGMQLDRLVVVRDRVIEVVPFLIGGAAVVVGYGEIAAGQVAGLDQRRAAVDAQIGRNVTLAVLAPDPVLRRGLRRPVLRQLGAGAAGAEPADGGQNPDRDHPVVRRYAQARYHDVLIKFAPLPGQPAYHAGIGCEKGAVGAAHRRESSPTPALPGTAGISARIGRRANGISTQCRRERRCCA